LLSLVFAESALELVPTELHNHNSIVSHSKRIGKKPSEILLDISFHYAAMKGIENESKRGRPDLIHFSLLEACSIPSYFNRKLAVYVHTIDNKVIFVGENVRLPKSYHRFAGLIEKLYLEGKIVSDGITLLEIKDMTFNSLIDKISPSKVVGLSIDGLPSSYSDIAQNIGNESCLVVGGFAKGHFSNNILNRVNKLLRVDNISLDAHIIVSRVLYEYEKTIFK